MNLDSSRGATAATPVATPAALSAWAHPSGSNGVQPSSWLTPGVLIAAPKVTSEPAAVAITSGPCESIRVCASWVETSATSAAVEARRGAKVKP